MKTSHAAQLQENQENYELEEFHDDVEVKWPESTVPIDEALLKAFQTWVLRFILSPLATPNQILNALRRLEVMKEFPLRQEKQARTLALAEARVELRRRSLGLREALLKERREIRETAAAKAVAKAARAELKGQPPVPAEKPASAPSIAPVIVENAVNNKVPQVPIAAELMTSTTATSLRKDLVPLPAKAFGVVGSMLKECGIQG